MNFLRHKATIRVIALFLMIVFLQSLFTPAAMALTTGPHQQEFTSYEEPGASDMVNLLTGDFAFNIPLLEVPGPEGGFSMPLSYHSGVGLDQESSWVGLGWTLNPGAIIRNVVEYPDDANGEEFVIHRENDNVSSGWTAGIPGAFQFGYENNVGHFGNISILGLVGISMKNGKIVSGNILALNFENGKMDSDPLAIPLSAIMVASMAANASTETISEVAEAADKSKAIGSAIEKSKLAFSVAASAKPMSFSGYWNLSGWSKSYGLFKNWHILLDETRTESMYGVLNLSNMDASYQLNEGLNPIIESSVGDINSAVYVPYEVNNFKGAASDMQYHVGNTEYYKTNNPTSLAMDNYSVYGNGISGNIKPYRLDIGTLSMPKRMSRSHVRLALSPFLKGITYNYKVQFLYNGTFSNNYYHHVGASEFDYINQIYNYNFDDPQLGISFQKENEVIENFMLSTYVASADLKYLTTGDKILPQYFDRLIPGSNTTVAIDREGLGNNQLTTANHIKYYTNAEILNSPNGFIGIFPKGSAEQQNFRRYMVNEMNYERGVGFVTAIGEDYYDVKRRLGAFAITKADGSTYHYSLPVYEYDNYSFIQKIGDDDNITTMERLDPFPSTWLLTAITGADYYDRNNDGMVGPEDWGKWIRFDYGKYSNEYHWRMPFDGYRHSPDDESRTYNEGNRQVYYLDAITTRSHTALFLKTPRQDGHSKELNRPQPPVGPDALGLKKIVLLKNEDYNYLTANTPEGLEFNKTVRNPINETCPDCTYWSIPVSTSNAELFLREKALRVIEFHTSYDLCPGVPNSSVNDPTQGKLTLTGISQYGKNNFKVVPDYQFDYISKDTPYHPNAWDGWGMYNGFTGTTDDGDDGHYVSSYLDAKWHLFKITTPLGNEMRIDYARDDFLSLAGIISDPSNNKKGGNFRVSRIRTTNENNYKNDIRYIYTLDGTTASGSSGVISNYPEYIYSSIKIHPEVMDWPFTPVMYSKVTVLKGKLEDENDFLSKEIYEFFTPDRNMIEVTKDVLTQDDLDGYELVIETKKLKSEHGVTEVVPNKREYIMEVNNKVHINTSKIGKIKSIKLYDAQNKLISTNTMYYDDDPKGNHQGLFTEGTILAERLDPFTENENSFDKIYHKVMRTTKYYHPYIMNKMVTEKDGFVGTVEYKDWDFITGLELRTISTGPMGEKIETVTTPAYKKYEEMGPINLSAANKHMLTQEAEHFTYRLNSSEERIGLLSASVSTWDNNWDNYRELNGGVYADGNAENHNVWRKKAGYFWKGTTNSLNTDGTYNLSSFTPFDFEASANPGWVKAGEILRYDHYSLPVETENMTGIRSSTKMNSGQIRKISEAGNAGYNEMAFSGAEDFDSSTGYFGGEVTKSSGSTVTNSLAHTGENCLQVNAGNKGFVFNADLSETDFDRYFKASVWVNESQLSDARIYYRIDGGTEQYKVSGTPLMKAGDWCLMNVQFHVPASVNTLEVGCYNNGSSNGMYFDDFRIHPLDAGMVSYVYNDDGALEYVMGNNNLYARYEYDDAGQIIATFVEVINEPVKEKVVSRSAYNYAGVWGAEE